MDDERVIGVMCLAYYLYNTSGETFAVDMFGHESHPNYLREYAEIYAVSPARALGKLDVPHLRKLTDLAVTRYEAAARLSLEKDL